jgi:hypothetical protein
MSRYARTISSVLAAAVLWAPSVPARGIHPPSIEEAIPPGATEAVFLESLGDLDPALDSLASVAGAEEAYAFLEASALPYLAMEATSSPNGDSGGLDLDRGLGLFSLPGSGPVSARRD